jgi:hypothetical protein
MAGGPMVDAEEFGCRAEIWLNVRLSTAGTTAAATPVVAAVAINIGTISDPTLSDDNTTAGRAPARGGRT